MEVVRRETLTPSEVGMEWMSDNEYAVLLYGFRCKRGCIGTFRIPVPRGILLDTAALVGMEDAANEFADAHVCLRKAIVGDRHRCALCGWADVVNRRGELREHLRVVGTGLWGGSILAPDPCPGGSVGRRVA